MKKLLLVGALALGGVSCAPDIKQDPPADNVVAQFDPAASPAVVPSPNDLALNPATGLVAAPIDPTAPAAQQEFTRDYINTLNGFPTSVVATTKIADLDESSISANTVRFIDLLKGTAIGTPDVTPTVKYDAETDTLSISPPATGWPKGGRYAVALVGGADGLKGTNGKPVVGSAVWGFASSSRPLVTCEDLTAPNCRATTEIIPSTETDPAKRLEDQTATALRLEQLRRAYAPLLDAISKQGVERNDIVLLWTFRIMNMPEATFDPAASVIPFPNDLLRNPTTGRLNLPTPPNASPLLQQLITGLNTLDGFSTSSAIVSENSDARGAIDTGSRLDPGSLATGAQFMKLTPGGTQPNVTACLNCVSSTSDTSASNPQQLQFVPQVPLDEKSQYAAIMTTDLKDERGRKVAPTGAFALVRLSSPLVKDGKSQVSGVSDANANALEPVRAGLKPLFDALEARPAALGGPLKRSQIALAWAFTTQSTVSVLAQLHALPSTQYAAAGVPAAAAYVTDQTATVLPAMGASNPQLPTAGIGRILQGSIFAPFAVTGPNGTLNPGQPRIDRIPFVLTTPSSAMPAEGYPVAVFSHGLSGNHMNGLAIASALASQGFAMVSIDNPFHGERSSCVGTAAQLGAQSDDAACVDSAAQRCETTASSASYGRCVARNPASADSCNPSPTAVPHGDVQCATVKQGRCLPTGMCEGGDFRRTAAGSPVISGANFLNVANLFATRDNFRQHAIDLGQLVRVVNSNEIDAQISAATGTGLKLDGTKIVYVGQSLGAILGTLSTSVSPNVGNVVLNVPGGNLTGILLTSPHMSFARLRTGFLKTLSDQGITPGTPAFDQFIGLARTILDPADPVNYSYYVENGSVPPTREALIQYIQNDEITPNPTTQALINAANNRDASKKKVETSLWNPAASLTERHGFLLNFADRTVTESAQSEAAQFLKTGTKP
jgi:hypothetical protein